MHKSLDKLILRTQIGGVGRIDEFDSLRFFGALCVMIYHYCQNAPLIGQRFTGIFQFPFSLGGQCAYLFFILSGFLMQEKYREKIGDYFNFMWNRMRFLVIPVFLTKLLDIVLIFILLKLYSTDLLNNYNATMGLSPVNFSNIITDFQVIGVSWITGTFYNSVTWFVSILFLCYTVFWILKKIFISIEEPIWIFLMLTGYYLWFYSKFTNHIWIGIGLTFFSIGCLLNKIDRHMVSKECYATLILLNTATAILLIIMTFLGEMGTVFGSTAITVGFFFFPLSVILAFRFRPISRLLRIPALVSLGKCSMAVFLLHFIILRLLVWIDIAAGDVIEFNSLKVLCVYILTVIGISLLWNYLIENKLNHYIIEKLLGNYPG